MTKPVSKLIGILIIAIFFLAGYFIGRQSVAEIHETVRIDTCFYEKPAPHRVVQRPIAVRVPRVIFAPNNAIPNTGGLTDSISGAPTCSTMNSVRAEIEMQTLIYEDSLYQAQVSGPAVGEYTPTLDFIKIYATERVRTSVLREAPRWEIGPAVGAWMASDENRMWCGIAARRNFGRLSLSGTIGYDIGNRSALVQVGAAWSIWLK